MKKKNDNLKRNIFFAVTAITTLYFLYTLNKNKMNKDNTSDLSPDDKKKKKNGTMDKVVFGLLVGGAIGSVLGLTMAPDKGKKVRNKIKTKGGNAIEKGKEFLDENEDAVSLVASKSKGVFSFFTDRIFSKNKNSGKSSILDWLEDMEEIPSEVEEVAQ